MKNETCETDVKILQRQVDYLTDENARLANEKAELWQENYRLRMEMYGGQVDICDILALGMEGDQ